jgi:hypothetical protein
MAAHFSLQDGNSETGLVKLSSGEPGPKAGTFAWGGKGECRKLLWALGTLAAAILALYIYVNTLPGPCEPRTYICISRFATEEEMSGDALDWAPISDLVQSFSRLLVSANGSVAEEDADTWPVASLRDAAHANGTRIWAGAPS